MKKYIIIAAVVILVIYLIKKFKSNNEIQSASDSADSGLAPKEPHVNIMQAENVSNDTDVIDTNASFVTDRFKRKLIVSLMAKMTSGTATLEDKKQLKELLK